MPKSKEVISDSESGSASGSGSESEEEVKSKSKPKKVEKKKKQESSASSESEEDTKSKKRSQKDKDDKKPAKKAKKDDDEPVWDIGSNKQVTVRNFRGKWFVDIREMYQKDGKMLPGKKGICMNIDNWKALYKVVEEVNDCVKSKC